MKLLLLTVLVCAAAGQSTSLTNNANERASQLAGNTDTYFAPADAPKCYVDSAGRTIVHYRSSQHPSFKCYHTDTNHCKCESVHPTHHKGLCKVFHASSGKAHVLGGNCGTSGMNTMSSCKQILAADPTAKSGMYTLKRASDGATFSAYCDMSYDGGGWTQCMRSAFRYEARHLFTKTYKQVFPTTSAGDGTSSNWYDFCPQLKGADYIAGIQNGAGVDNMLSALRFTDSEPFRSSGEWASRGVKARKVDNIKGTMKFQCGGGGGNDRSALSFWIHMNPAYRGLVAFQRGHFHCSAPNAAGSPGHWGPSIAAHAEPQYGDVTFSTQNYHSHQCIYKLSSGCNYGGCSGRVHGNQAYPARGQFATSSSVRHWTWSSTAQSGFGCYYGTVPSTVPGNMLGAGNPTPTINAAATSVLYRE